MTSVGIISELSIEDENIRPTDPTLRTSIMITERDPSLRFEAGKNSSYSGVPNSYT